MVPTVERGLRDADFWSIEIAGDRPSMKSTSGLSINPKNWRAYAESDSTYRRCPSAYSVSNANEDFPDPDSPVNTTSLSRGIVIVISLRLCTRAPLITIFSLAIKEKYIHDLPKRKAQYEKHPICAIVHRLSAYPPLASRLRNWTYLSFCIFPRTFFALMRFHSHRVHCPISSKVPMCWRRVTSIILLERKTQTSRALPNRKSRLHGAPFLLCPFIITGKEHLYLLGLLYSYYQILSIYFL